MCLRKSTKLPYQPGKKFSTSLPLLLPLFTHNPVSSAGRATSALCARLTCGSYSTIRALHHLHGMRCGATLNERGTHITFHARYRTVKGSSPLSGVNFFSNSSSPWKPPPPLRLLFLPTPSLPLPLGNSLEQRDQHIHLSPLPGYPPQPLGP